MASHAKRFDRLMDREIIKAFGALPLLAPILDSLGLREIVSQRLVSVNDGQLHGRAGDLPEPPARPKTSVQGRGLGCPDGADRVARRRSREAARDDRIGRVLDDLEPHTEEIWQTLCLKAIERYQVDLSVILYDITSFYFEGHYDENEAVAFGYSRDHRPDTKQRVVGLNVTGSDGVPLLYELLAGNTSDCTTAESNLARLRSFLGRLPMPPNWPLLVCDQALVSGLMLVRGFGSHVHLLGPLNDRVDSRRALLDEVTTDELRASPLPYRPKRAKPTDSVPYYGVSRRVTFRALIDGEAVTVPGQVLVVLSESKLRLDRDHRQAELTRLEESPTAIATKLNQRRHKSRDYVLQRIENARRGNKAKGLVDVELLGEDGQLELRWSVNTEKLAWAEARDGKYSVGTTDLALAAADILAKMKLRDGVERRIGGFKGLLKVRPIFVQTESRIRGLVFLTMVALLAFSLLELQLRRAHQPQTARSVIERFDNLQAVYLMFRDGSMVRHAAEPLALQAHLLAILVYPLPKTYLEPGCQRAPTSEQLTCGKSA